MSTPETADLRAQPDADWFDIWRAMRALGAAVAPLLELASPPPWAVSLQFVMDMATPAIDEHCAEKETDDAQS